MFRGLPDLFQLFAIPVILLKGQAERIKLVQDKTNGNIKIINITLSELKNISSGGMISKFKKAII